MMDQHVQDIFAVLQQHSGRIIAETIIESYERRLQRSSATGREMRPNARLKALQHSIKLFVASAEEQRTCINEIEDLLAFKEPNDTPNKTLDNNLDEIKRTQLPSIPIPAPSLRTQKPSRITAAPSRSMQRASLSAPAHSALRPGHAAGPVKHEVEIERESDIVLARQKVRDLCVELGADRLLQTKITTVVSEMARNIFQYVGRGFMRFTVTQNGRAKLDILARDFGPGIPHIDIVLAEKYQSKTGMGRGILSMKKIMDEFDIRTGPDIGTEIKCSKYIG